MSWNAACRRRSEANTTRLILTTEGSGAGALKQAGLADIVVPLGFKLVWGPLPPDAELATLFAPRAPEQDPAIVMRATRRAGCHSLRLARQSSRGAMISAGTIRCIAGGAAPN